MALPSTGDSRVWEVPHTCTLEDLVLYFFNSRRVRPQGLSAEYPLTPFPFLTDLSTRSLPVFMMMLLVNFDSH